MITLNELTAAQVEMCERVWACKSMKEFELLHDQLSLPDRQMAITLMELMLQESVEEELEAMEDYPLAEQLIARAKKG